MNATAIIKCSSGKINLSNLIPIDTSDWVLHSMHMVAPLWESIYNKNRIHTVIFTVVNACMHGDCSDRRLKAIAYPTYHE